MEQLLESWLGSRLSSIRKRNKKTERASCRACCGGSVKTFSTFHLAGGMGQAQAPRLAVSLLAPILLRFPFALWRITNSLKLNLAFKLRELIVMMMTTRPTASFAATNTVLVIVS